jgi:hypothetical protein
MLPYDVAWAAQAEWTTTASGRHPGMFLKGTTL